MNSELTKNRSALAYAEQLWSEGIRSHKALKRHPAKLATLSGLLMKEASGHRHEYVVESKLADDAILSFAEYLSKFDGNSLGEFNEANAKFISSFVASACDYASYFIEELFERLANREENSCLERLPPNSPLAVNY